MPTKILLAHKNVWLALAVLWTLTVAMLCLVRFDELPSIVNEKGADKIGHLSFHFMFTLLWFGYFYGSTQKALLKVFATSVIYGILIEIMQGLFTETRKADINDVAANTCGALIAVIFILLLLKKTQKDTQLKVEK